jgi:hypothetical protein
MRLLYFNVNTQKIEKEPTCDFTNLVSGTSGYLKAHFTFSSEWEGCVKCARFWRGETEHAVLLQNDECEIPAEALVGSTFRVSILGQRGDYRITTNKVLIRQEVAR